MKAYLYHIEILGGVRLLAIASGIEQLTQIVHKTYGNDKRIKILRTKEIK